MSTTEDLKTVAQIRKAILPLIEIVKREADRNLDERLAAIEDAVKTLGAREINIPAPNVTVKTEVPKDLVNSFSRLSKQATPTIKNYQPHDQSSGTVKYNGFVAEDGSWYIQRLAKGQQRYAKGRGDYQDAWEGRGKLSYGNFDGSK